MPPPNRYRTLWISDLHLGTRQAQAEYLVDFLRYHPADRLYLVGDIVDGWALQRSWYWPPSHNEVVQELLQIAQSGTEVTYIPGNHDEAVRAFPEVRWGGIRVRRRAVHTTAQGDRLLVLHGDEFDGVVRHARWVSVLGASMYQGTLRLNRWLNRVRRWLGLPYWSLSAYLKYKTKRAVQFIADFEQAVARSAHEAGVDGVVCGHIHHAELRTIGGVLYANTGDWVESCTALAEHDDGQLEILRWRPTRRSVESMGVAAPSGDGQARTNAPALVVPDSVRRVRTAHAGAG